MVDEQLIDFVRHHKAIDNVKSIENRDITIQICIAYVGLVCTSACLRPGAQYGLALIHLSNQLLPIVLDNKQGVENTIKYEGKYY